jgi:hypothetical protein
MALRPDVHERLLLGKYLFGQATQAGASGNMLAITTALLFMHDAAELIMLAVLDHIGARPKSKREFMDFWADVKAAGLSEPQFRIPMEQLNSMRVALKHKGVLPNVDAVRKLLPGLEAFFAHVTQEYLELSFSDLSLADLVENAQARDLIKQAEQEFANGKRTDALVNIRIAFLVLEDRIKAVPLLRLPRQPHISSILSSVTGGGNRMNRDLRDLGKYFEQLHNTIAGTADTANMLMLGGDPRKYWSFLASTPNVYRMADGSYRPAPFFRNWDNVTEPVFRSCVEFVIEYALATAAL